MYVYIEYPDKSAVCQYALFCDQRRPNQTSEIAFSQMQSVVRKVKFLMLIFGHVLIRIFGRWVRRVVGRFKNLGESSVSRSFDEGFISNSSTLYTMEQYFSICCLYCEPVKTDLWAVWAFGHLGIWAEHLIYAQTYHERIKFSWGLLRAL